MRNSSMGGLFSYASLPSVAGGVLGCFSTKARFSCAEAKRRTRRCRSPHAALPIPARGVCDPRTRRFPTCLSIKRQRGLSIVNGRKVLSKIEE